MNKTSQQTCKASNYQTEQNFGAWISRVVADHGLPETLLENRSISICAIGTKAFSLMGATHDWNKRFLRFVKLVYLMGF